MPLWCLLAALSPSRQETRTRWLWRQKKARPKNTLNNTQLQQGSPNPTLEISHGWSSLNWSHTHTLTPTHTNSHPHTLTHTHSWAQSFINCHCVCQPFFLFFCCLRWIAWFWAHRGWQMLKPLGLYCPLSVPMCQCQWASVLYARSMGNVTYRPLRRASHTHRNTHTHTYMVSWLYKY